jgi:hypothetical protein
VLDELNMTENSHEIRNQQQVMNVPGCIFTECIDGENIVMVSLSLVQSVANIFNLFSIPGCPTRDASLGGNDGL